MAAVNFPKMLNYPSQHTFPVLSSQFLITTLLTEHRIHTYLSVCRHQPGAATVAHSFTHVKRKPCDAGTVQSC